MFGGYLNHLLIEGVVQLDVATILVEWNRETVRDLKHF